MTRTEVAQAMAWAKDEHEKQARRPDAERQSEHRLLMEYLGDMAMRHYFDWRDIRVTGGLGTPEGRPMRVFHDALSLVVRAFATGDMLNEHLRIGRAEHAQKSANIYVAVRILTRDGETGQPWAQASLDGWCWWSGFERFAVAGDGLEEYLQLAHDGLESFAGFEDNLERNGS
jgi:hypothetical protein